MINKIFSKLKSFSRDEKGAFAVTLALSLIPLIMATGVSIDLSRAYVVRSRLSYALDAAGLAVGASDGTEEELTEVFNNYFAKNYPDDEMGDEVELNLSITSSTISISAVRRVETTFMNLAGIEFLDVAVSSEITRETKGLEVALVLDNTGSMASGGKIGALRTAATDLLEILFAGNDYPEKLKASIVPYVTTVNIGTAMKDWVDFSDTQLSGDDAADISAYGTDWKGCVMARDYPYNVQNAPVGEGGYWKAYTWPKEPFYRYNSGTNSSNCSNRSNSTGSKWNSIDEISTDSNTGTSGPNKSCPRELTPLTNDRQHLLDEIDALVPWGNSGTMSHMGIFWGTETLSPEPPFDEGEDWEEPGWNKALIVMTDGVNELVKQNSICYESTTRRPLAAYWPSGGPYTDYSGEGYPVDDGRLDLGTGSDATKYNNMKTLMNKFTAEACEYAKSKGIIVYTITFQLNDATMQNLYRNCATDSSKYFNSPTNEALASAFKAIGAELSNLRISK